MLTNPELSAPASSSRSSSTCGAGEQWNAEGESDPERIAGVEEEEAGGAREVSVVTQAHCGNGTAAFAMSGSGIAYDARRRRMELTEGGSAGEVLLPAAPRMSASPPKMAAQPTTMEAQTARLQRLRRLTRYMILHEV